MLQVGEAFSTGRPAPTTPSAKPIPSKLPDRLLPASPAEWSFPIPATPSERPIPVTPQSSLDPDPIHAGAVRGTKRREFERLAAHRVAGALRSALTNVLMDDAEEQLRRSTLQRSEGDDEDTQGQRRLRRKRTG